MWSVDHSARTTLPAEAVWESWADVSRWREWNPDIEAVELRGPFAAGSTIAMTPRGAPEPVELHIIEALEGARFVDQASLGGTVITTVHEIQPLDGGLSRVVYRLEAVGPAADELGPAISADFPETIAGLLAHAASNVPA